jgi:demethylmenaquinone methyltransferase/2-methoxy-6-polyprenyl-1,4-benzoquinol methylase
MMHDFTLPPEGWRLSTWRLYFFITRRTVARVLPAWQEIYQGLPELIEETRWLPQFQEALAAEGLRDISVEHLTMYGAAIVTAVKA